MSTATPASYSTLSQIGIGVNWDSSYDSANTTLAQSIQARLNSTVVTPAQQFCFVDAHPDTVLGVLFSTFSLPTELANLPASHHNNSSSLSFADGHIEVHRWATTNILAPILGVDNPSAETALVGSDAAWICSHTCYGNQRD
jgi:prepilin-type processing-associated H-X9-DG protein